MVLKCCLVLISQLLMAVSCYPKTTDTRIIHGESSGFLYRAFAAGSPAPDMFTSHAHDFAMDHGLQGKMKWYQTQPGHKRLQLVVQWSKQPEDQTGWKEYHLTVGAQSSPNMTICKKRFLEEYKYVTETDPTEVVFPREMHNVIIPGCTYFIQLKSVNSGSTEQTITRLVTAPTCIDSVCQCSAISRLPPPIMTSLQISSGTADRVNISVSGRYPAGYLTNRTVLNFSLRLRWKNSDLFRYKFMKQDVEPENDTDGDLSFTSEFENVPIVNSYYNLSISAVDNQNCFSDPLNHLFQACAGGLCQCSTKSRLQPPILQTLQQIPQAMNNLTVAVSWSYPTGLSLNRTVAYFTLRLSSGAHSRTIVAKNVSGLSGDKKIYVAQLGNVSFNTKYNLTIFAVDNYGCKSASLEHVLPTTAEFTGTATTVAEYQQKLILPVVLPAVAITLVVALSAMFLWRRYSKKLKRWWLIWFKLDRSGPVPIRATCHSNVLYTSNPSSDCSGRRFRNPYLTVMSSREERSVLYVEKEIEEARENGDADGYEISYQRLNLLEEIGRGAFGCVHSATAEAINGTPGIIHVAVKRLKKKATDDEIEDFLAEIAMLKRVGYHPNIVTMLACCTLQQPYCIVMEFIPRGDLLQYLRRLRYEYEKRHPVVQACACSSGQRAHRRPSDGPSGLQKSNSQCSILLSRSCHTSTSGSSTGGSSLSSNPTSRMSTVSSQSSSYIVPDCTGQCSRSKCRCHQLDSSPQGTARKTGKRKKDMRIPDPFPTYVLDMKELQDFALHIARGMAHLEEKGITHRDLAARNILIDDNKTLKISDFGLSRSGIYVNTKVKKVPLRWLSIEAMRDCLYSSKSDVWAFGVVLWEIGTLGGFPYPTIQDRDLLKFLLEGKRLDRPDNVAQELYEIMLECWSHLPDSRPTFTSLCRTLSKMAEMQRVYINTGNFGSELSLPPAEDRVCVLSTVPNEYTKG